MSIIVYNINSESHDNEPYNFYIGRPSILSNPYTHIKDRKTKAIYIVKDRDEAIEKYSHYFDVQYNGNPQFKEIIDRIYKLYREGKDIYLGCFCHPLPCHGDIIAKNLQKRLIKEKISQMNIDK